jgi:hypothetical protein
MVEKNEYLQEDGHGRFTENVIKDLKFLPHSSNCFNYHNKRIIDNQEISLIFIYKSNIEPINIYPLYLLQKYNYNVIKINLSAIISSEGVKLDMKNYNDREQLKSITTSNTLLQYLKGYDDVFCLFLLYTLKQNTDLSVFLLSTDKFEDIKGDLNNINDFVDNKKSNYIERIYVKDINDTSIDLYIDSLLINNMGFDVTRISRKVSDKKIYRNGSNKNIKTDYYTYYKKYLKYKKKYIELSNK